jgi:hypothetical protein
MLVRVAILVSHGNGGCVQRASIFGQNNQDFEVLL